MYVITLYHTADRYTDLWHTPHHTSHRRATEKYRDKRGGSGRREEPDTTLRGWKGERAEKLHDCAGGQRRVARPLAPPNRIGYGWRRPPLLSLFFSPSMCMYYFTRRGFFLHAMMSFDLVGLTLEGKHMYKYKYKYAHARREALRSVHHVCNACWSQGIIVNTAVVQIAPKQQETITTTDAQSNGQIPRPWVPTYSCWPWVPKQQKSREKKKHAVWPFTAGTLASFFSRIKTWGVLCIYLGLPQVSRSKKYYSSINSSKITLVGMQYSST